MNIHWPILLGLIVMSATFWLMPHFSRFEFLFGVTVRPDFRDSQDGKRILLRYKLLIAAAALLAAALHGSGALTGPAPILLFAAAGIGAWAWGARMTRPFASPVSAERSAAIDPGPNVLHFSWALRLGPYAILLAGALILLYEYGLLPDPLTVHWGGPEPDRFQPKTWLIAFRPLIIAATICLLMEVTKASLASKTLTRRLTSIPDDREPRFFRLNLYMLSAAQYWMAALFSWIALVIRGPLAADWMSPQFQLYSVMFFALGPLPLLIYLKLSYGQGGSRLPATADPVVSGDKTPDACWKLGQFYFNPDDAAIWVERRAGFGYTLNFARPLSWIWLAGVLGGPLLLMRVLR